jgi:hypothetical protein
MSEPSWQSVGTTTPAATDNNFPSEQPCIQRALDLLPNARPRDLPPDLVAATRFAEGDHGITLNAGAAYNPDQRSSDPQDKNDQRPVL